MQINITTNGFGVDSEIIINAAKKGLKISEEKIKVIYNTGNPTSTKNPISHTSEVIGSIVELVVVKHPLKYLGIPGIILLIIGVIQSTYVISIFNETRYFSIPVTLVTLGAITVGIMLLLVSGILFSVNQSKK